MNSRSIRYLQISMFLFDLFVLNCIFKIIEVLNLQDNSIQEYNYTYPGLLISLLWVIIALTGNVYSKRTILYFEFFSKKTLVALACISILFTLGFLLLYKSATEPSTILLYLCGIMIAISFSRFLFFTVYKYLQHKDFLLDKVVVIGYNSVSKKLVSYLEENEINKKVIGFCDETENVHELSNYPILSDINHAFEVCKQVGATEIYSCIAPEYNPEIYKLIQLADQNCIHFRFIPDINIFINRPCHIDFWNNMPVLSLRKEPLQRLENRLLKSVFDFTFSLFILCFILSWLIPVISLLIWMDSGRPIFFRQIRNGKDNRKFSCLKFRSMKVNDQADLKQATKNDNRLTRIGKFLRHTNLDELPQFLNVLKGEMSVVGPRPHMLKHTVEYSEKVSDFMVRHFVKPGITGWAQVNGYRGEIRSVDKLRNRVHYDLWYLENWSVWLDFKIIFLTVLSVVKGDKDAF